MVEEIAYQTEIGAKLWKDLWIHPCIHGVNRADADIRSSLTSILRVTVRAIRRRKCILKRLSGISERRVRGFVSISMTSQKLLRSRNVNIEETG